ncbi:hypothetical protein EB796_019702 [Bugula neritina]|uniref:Uncharacterized protein n=1 Tax=Bugula neritina TaxID=10212 RepID=A0A7J7J8M3_BUGNE|nr:hypothetical protein EB796_019702 [Bugula neritina]
MVTGYICYIIICYICSSFCNCYICYNICSVDGRLSGAKVSPRQENERLLGSGLEDTLCYLQQIHSQVYNVCYYYVICAIIFKILRTNINTSLVTYFICRG